MPKIVLDTTQLGMAELEHDLAHHTDLPETTVSRFIETTIDRIGALASWLWIFTIGVILYAVISRYIFARGTVMLEEIQWHLAGAAWLIGLSYTMVHDDHVRVDVIHENLSVRKQAIIECLGILFLLMPFLVLSLVELMPYAVASFDQNERSQSPNGLPMRWILKSVLPLSFLLLILSAFARFLRVATLLFKTPKPLQQTIQENINEDQG